MVILWHFLDFLGPKSLQKPHRSRISVFFVVFGVSVSPLFWPFLDLSKLTIFWFLTVWECRNLTKTPFWRFLTFLVDFGHLFGPLWHCCQNWDFLSKTPIQSSWKVSKLTKPLKTRKTPKISKNLQNVTDRSDTFRSDHFREKHHFFMNFRTKTTLKRHRSWTLRNRSCPIESKNPKFSTF